MVSRNARLEGPQEAPRSTNPPPGLTEEWHVLDYVRVLSKRRWTALLVFAGVLLLVGIGTYTAAPLYEARSQVLIEAESQNVVMFKDLVEQDKASSDYYQTQYKLLQ